MTTRSSRSLIRPICIFAFGSVLKTGFFLGVGYFVYKKIFNGFSSLSEDNREKPSNISTGMAKNKAEAIFSSMYGFGNGFKSVKLLNKKKAEFSFKDGSWGLIRASSNKPSLVIVTESPTSDERKLKIFYFIDELLKKTGKVGEYDQKI